MAYAKQDLGAKFLSTYESIAKKTISSGLLYDEFSLKAQELADSWDIKEEDKAVLLLQTLGEVTSKYNSDALSSAIALLKLEYDAGLTEQQGIVAEKDVAVRTAQAGLVSAQATTAEKQGNVYDRQRCGYDDNILVKAAEFKGGLANFAVNASPTTAQPTIDAFNAQITALTARVGTCS